MNFKFFLVAMMIVVCPICWSKTFLLGEDGALADVVSTVKGDLDQVEGLKYSIISWENNDQDWQSYIQAGQKILESNGCTNIEAQVDMKKSFELLRHTQAQARGASFSALNYVYESLQSLGEEDILVNMISLKGSSDLLCDCGCKIFYVFSSHGEQLTLNFTE